MSVPIDAILDTRYWARFVYSYVYTSLSILVVFVRELG